MHLRLEPMVPLLTPRGKGWAWMVTDRSQDHSFEWSVWMDDTGECWTFRNEEVRIQRNITMGRTRATPPASGFRAG